MLRSLATLVGKGPPHPPKGIDPRGVSAGALEGPKSAASGPPCGAKPRGGGGAPPTNLILLRNQFEATERPAAARTVPASTCLPAPRGASRPAPSQLAARLCSAHLLASPTATASPRPSRGVSGGSGSLALARPPTTPLAGPGSPSTRPPLGPLSSPGEGRFAPCPAAAQRPASGPARAEPKGSQGRRPRGIPNFPARGLFLVRGSWIWSLQIGSRHSLPPTGTSGPPPRARAPRSPSLSGHRLPGSGG